MYFNNGDQSEFPEDLFKNSYQNDQGDGKKTFLVLWLHAYKYTIPGSITSSDSESITVKSPIPAWGQEDYKLIIK